MVAYEDAGGSMCEARSALLEHRKAPSDVELTLKSTFCDCYHIASAAAKLAYSCRSMPHVRFSRSTFLRLKPRSGGAFFARMNGSPPRFTEIRLRG
jgi:hypothetical protein